MVYYIEIRKNSGEKTESNVLGERRFWKEKRNTENWKLKYEKDAEKTIHKRAMKKIMGTG